MNSNLCQVCEENLLPNGASACLSCWVSISTGWDFHAALTAKLSKSVNYRPSKLAYAVNQSPEWSALLDDSLLNKDTIIKVCEQVRIETQLIKARDYLSMKPGMITSGNGCERQQAMVINSKYDGLKLAVLEACSQTCAYCGVHVGFRGDLEATLPVPFNHRFEEDGRYAFWKAMVGINNYAVSCHGCNLIKGGFEWSGVSMLRSNARGVGMLQLKTSARLSAADLPPGKRLSPLKLDFPLQPEVYQKDRELFYGPAMTYLARMAFRVSSVCVCDERCGNLTLFLDGRNRRLTVCCERSMEAANGEILAKLFLPTGDSRELQHWRNRRSAQNKRNRKQQQRKE